MSARDFLIEMKLHELDPALHQRYRGTVFALPMLLSKYQLLFPEFTDHSETHSIAVIDNCKNILGNENIDRMNADELYVILMSCYLHDVGMGISQEDFVEFSKEIDFGNYFEKNKDAKTAEVVRAFHNEFSGCFIRKYADFFDFPSEDHTFAIIQTARGHRKTDLYDEEQYPSELALENGNTLSLPLLASALRLADEVNVARDRNSKLLFDPDRYSTEKQRIENLKHEAIKEMRILYDAIELTVETDDAEVMKHVMKLAEKLQKTLDYCAAVVADRTNFIITQNKILIK